VLAVGVLLCCSMCCLTLFIHNKLAAARLYADQEGGLVSSIPLCWCFLFMKLRKGLLCDQEVCTSQILL
jgi:hypothetical protein